ncbi:MAG: MG2 domain-containing protein, partial [Bacteroidales bacterium]|nr:MG2 domain-containing protein [Bacteroidales bacterium]
MTVNNYNEAWQKVDSLDRERLPESAVQVVMGIYAKAKKEDNASQLVKAIIHRLKYINYKEEESYLKNLRLVEDELKIAKHPVKPLLHSMLAEMYWNYYANNRYRFNQRTQVVNFDNEDIETWSLEHIVEKTIENYQLSLEQTNKLQSTDINLFNEVLYTGNELGRTYRPTLYDFLAHRAVDFYMGEEPSITKPAYAFVINDQKYLSGVEDFVKINIVTEDKLSHKYYALKIFQQLLKFHLEDKQPGALIEADLKRLSFVKQHLTLSNKSELYITALEKLKEKYSKSPEVARVLYRIAEAWVSEGTGYKPLQSDKHKWDVKKAYEICDQIRERYPKTDGAAMAFNLQQQIKSKFLSANVERVNVSQKPFLALLDYKNIDEVFWRAIPVTRKEVRAQRDKWRKNYNVDSEMKFLEHFLSKPTIKSGKIKLPQDGDFQQHSIEVPIEALPYGDYLIVFSHLPNFGLNKNGLAYNYTTISDLAYINRSRNNGTNDIYVLNRETGEPVQGATIKVIHSNYNYRSGIDDYSKGATFTSDADGGVTITYQANDKKYNRNNFYIEISYGDDKVSSLGIDTYFSGGQSIFQHKYTEPAKRSRTYFFLDRAIYRPGQTLYYKGILVSSDNKTSEILPSQKHTVTFYDVNYQVVATQEVTTNEYGTFSGSFTTPTSGLMGDMRLQIDDGENSNVYFSVEEYKRPKFEVEFEPVKESFRLNDEVKARGKAIAYSGAQIDGANVAYRVVRQARFPYWWFCWRGYYPSSPEVEITSGETETNEKGEFFVDFTAIPDASVDKSSDPTFIYRVFADVTDINGETHSAETQISVGYKSLQVGVNIQNIDKAEKTHLERKYSISTTNMMGAFQPAEGTITFWKLKNPSKTFKQRFWKQPDVHAMSRTEFYKMFPYDKYADEDNYLKWEKEKEAASIRFNTATSKVFELTGIRNWENGKYILEIKSKDAYGQEVKEVSYFDVLDSKSNKQHLPVIGQFDFNETAYEPGSEAILKLGSSEKISALYELELDNLIVQKEWIRLDDNKQEIKIPIKEEYRGGVHIHYVFVKNNRFY